MTIDWLNRIVYIYKTDMVQIEPPPNEGWKLDVPEFKKAITDRQDDYDGIAYPDIINHYPTVQLGGTVLASVVEIINDYKIVFEDGQYYVLLNGANTNIMEHLILNQVSVRSNNAAGMQDLSLLRSSVYGAEVVIDETNGRPGTLFPIGTLYIPVNNIDDALTISRDYNLRALRVIGDIVFESNAILDNMIVYGTQPISSRFTVGEEASTIASTFVRCNFDGILKENSLIQDSMIISATIRSGLVYNTALLGGLITIEGNVDPIVFFQCFSVANHLSSIPTISIKSGESITIANFAGAIKITDLTTDSVVEIYINEGRVIIDDSCVDGIIRVYGGVLEDSSGINCTVEHYAAAECDIDPSEFWNSPDALTEQGISNAVWNHNDAVSNDGISDAVWNKELPSGVTGCD